jgi:hypothetical protein
MMQAAETDNALRMNDPHRKFIRIGWFGLPQASRNKCGARFFIAFGLPRFVPIG